MSAFANIYEIDTPFPVVELKAIPLANTPGPPVDIIGKLTNQGGPPWGAGVSMFASPGMSDYGMGCCGMSDLGEGQGTIPVSKLQRASANSAGGKLQRQDARGPMKSRLLKRVVFAAIAAGVGVLAYRAWSRR